MSVKISFVDNDSACGKVGIAAGSFLLSINGFPINDVLDYRFYASAKRLNVEISDSLGEKTLYRLKTSGDPDDLGLHFDTYLMDKQRSCNNKCVFCFVDQTPPGMRESLYFKDDDSRLSFLFGNYVTLTNMTERDIDRIVKMKISPVNISVHTMNPELRVSMMRNKRAGEVLSYIEKLASCGVDINAQLVLCPNINDGNELIYSLKELYKFKDRVISVAAVPVGLTKYRDNLPYIAPYTRESAAEVIEIIENFNKEHYNEISRNFCYPADEFYIKASKTIPGADFYGDFNQLDNGVGMWSLTKSEFLNALNEKAQAKSRKVALITGEAAYPLMTELSKKAVEKFPNLHIDVKEIINDFFGRTVTVAGLITAGDIIKQTKDLSYYDIALIPFAMLKSEEEKVFLDDVSLDDLSKTLKVKIDYTKDGRDLLNKITG